MFPSAYVFVTTSLELFYLTYKFNIALSTINNYRIIFAIIAPVIMALRGVRKKSLDWSGCLSGIAVGFFLTLPNLAFFSCLFTTFVLGTKATKFRSSLKKAFEANYKEGGQRNWEQILSNVAVPAQLALLYLNTHGPGELAIDFRNDKIIRSSFLAMAVVASLSCCFGDTLASELGSVFGGECPRLITTLQKVPRGTNGAVSFHGTCYSFLGGLLIGLSYALTVSCCLFSFSIFSFAQTVFGAGLAGLFGSFLDSLLGARLQYSGLSENSGQIVEHPGPEVKHLSGIDVLSNHSVNLISSVLTAAAVPSLMYVLFKP